MNKESLPLKQLSIEKIYNVEKATYEVPIYQRNFAWEYDEISALVHDIYDAFLGSNIDLEKKYYIGTLVSFNKGNNIFEVIDGQQRLTTINLLLHVLGLRIQNKLTYRARQKADNTLKSIWSSGEFNKNLFSKELDEMDSGIINGLKYANAAINNIVPKDYLAGFKRYFLNNVYLIHYEVPKDVNLNHYFEIMNSRGEQLEKHEVIKARLLAKLDSNKEVEAVFTILWEICSDMNSYVQQKYYELNNEDITIFGSNFIDFRISSFDELPEMKSNPDPLTIEKLICEKGDEKQPEKKERIDSFQEIIDFPNFLLIVLKITLITENNTFNPENFNLDDKELINEFDKIEKLMDKEFVKKFAFNLLKAKYFLDNYIVHHSKEDDMPRNNPWKLQNWQNDSYVGLKNLDGESDIQNKLVQLLSMFEVSFSPRQRKNYLFYCLLHLFNAKIRDIKEYYNFVSSLADKYFHDIYIKIESLNEDKKPKPGIFDNMILVNNKLDITLKNNNFDFTSIYGDGTSDWADIPLFVFNYMDYKIWEKYYNELHGKNSKQEDKINKDFFEELGCNYFKLDNFRFFYFSRTRRSLEHFYPQVLASDEKGTIEEGSLTVEQINCFGNYAMIGNEINSAGSGNLPIHKLSKYMDTLKEEFNLVSVASLKFMIMMKICKDNKTREIGQEWNYEEDIKQHQQKMLNILKDACSSS